MGNCFEIIYCYFALAFRAHRHLLCLFDWSRDFALSYGLKHIVDSKSRGFFCCRSRFDRIRHNWTAELFC